MVGVRFPRQLIWTHRGAGKGHGGFEGSSWVTAMGIRKYTASESLGKMNAGNRREKPFINNYLDGNQGVDQLADIVAEESGDVIVNNLLIK